MGCWLEYFGWNIVDNNRQSQQTYYSMMNVFHIDQFKCSLCGNWFCPPYNLPYLLGCTHSICTHCLELNKQSGNKKIVCPQDLEVSSVSQLRINQLTKKALERLMKQHNNFSQNTQLDCIKTLSISFDETLQTYKRQLESITALIDEIYSNEIKRIKGIWQKTKLELNRPQRIVTDWKEIVKIYLSKLKKNQGIYEGGSISSLNHYIEEGRKIKMELNSFFSLDFHRLAEDIVNNPQICLQNTFIIGEQKQQRKINNKQTINHYQPQNHNKQVITHYQPQNQRISLTKTIRIKQSNQQTSHNIEQKNNQMNIKSINNNLDINKQTMNANNKYNNSNIKQKQIYMKSSGTQRFNEMIRQNTIENLQKKQQQDREVIINNVRNIKRINDKQQDQENQHYFYKTYQSDENFVELYQQPSFIKSSPSHNKPPKSKQTILITQENIEKSLEKQKKIIHHNSINRKYNNKENLQDFVTPIPIQQLYTQQAHEQQHDEMLLSDCKDSNNWALGKMNFLKNPTHQDLEIRQKGYYDCQKQKINYMKRMQMLKVQQALQQTQSKDNYIQLIKHSLHDVDMGLYLSHFDWNHIQIVKFVVTSLNDHQLNILLNHLLHSRVHTLVLTSNNLTDLSLDAILNFMTVNNILKNVYLQKNYVNILKNKAKISLLKDKGINIYI